MKAEKKNNWKKRVGLIVTIGLLIAVAWGSQHSDPNFMHQWEALAEPGPLSQAHATLENNCSACHTTVIGVEANKCILCHANNQSILKRQPTAFHANIQTCKECHLEHRGRNQRPTVMDHIALAKIGLKQMADPDNSSDEERNKASQFKFWLSHLDFPNEPRKKISPRELILNCMTCHRNEDVHFGFFGKRCEDCHVTKTWAVSKYKHPSARSMDCSQCHQAPPSHYMKHFKMISQKVAGKPKARVDQCFLCHQTTSWIDILETGLYKHH
ncbi:cytochrome c3 family protein [Nitrospina gracilis]|nr:cytochrome c3 family protein [Nitrospina gracilis]